MIEHDRKKYEKKYPGISTYFYHLWLVYNLNMNETHSVEATHEAMRDYFKRKDPNNYGYMDNMLKLVELSLPRGDSKLIEKIKSYD